jgi:hypothetical protein
MCESNCQCQSPGKYWPKNGDEVEVVLRGKVFYANSNDFTVGTPGRGGTNVIHPAKDHVKSVRLIEPPVTVFRPGQIVVYKTGDHRCLILRDGYVNLNSRSFHPYPGFEFTSEKYTLEGEI